MIDVQNELDSNIMYIENLPLEIWTIIISNLPSNFLIMDFKIISKFFLDIIRLSTKSLYFKNSTNNFLWGFH